MTERQAHEEIGSTAIERSEANSATDQMVARLFDHWRLSSSDQAALLGQSVEFVGQTVASNDVRERIGHLLGIHAQLRALFPKNPDLAYSWMSTPNLAFSDLAPVTVARNEGIDGLRKLRAYLDQAIGA